MCWQATADDLLTVCLRVWRLQIPHQRPPSGTKERPRPAFGKKQYENVKNHPQSGASKTSIGSGYAQNYGTITASGLTALQSKKW